MVKFSRVISVAIVLCVFAVTAAAQSDDESLTFLCSVYEDVAWHLIDIYKETIVEDQFYFSLEPLVSSDGRYIATSGAVGIVTPRLSITDTQNPGDFIDTINYDINSDHSSAVAWSADNRILIFVTQDNWQTENVDEGATYILNMETGELEQLFPFRLRPYLSPDENHVIYSDGAYEWGFTHLNRITGMQRTFDNGNSHALHAWSPDSEFFLYSVRKTTTGRAHLRLYNSQTGLVRELRDDINVIQAFWMEDTQIYVLTLSRELYILNPQTNELTFVSDYPAEVGCNNLMLWPGD